MEGQFMKFGVVFPQNQLSDDPIVIRDFVQAAEEMGYLKPLLEKDNEE